MALRERIEAGKSAPDWLCALSLVALVFVAYARVFHAGFIWDDEAHLTQNPVVIGPMGFREIWTTAQAVYYPLVLTTFWALHKMAGLMPAPYHVLNVLIHSLNAILLWRVLRELRVRGAWLGAALWALHPVMVQSVAWVTELKNTQSCLFYLLSILFFVKTDSLRDRVWTRRLALAVFFFGLAITSKASTVMLPVVLLLCLWWRYHKFAGRDVAVLAPFFLISIAASAWTIWEQKFHSGAVGVEWAQTWPERFVISGRAILFYLGKLAWPHPLIFIYPRWTVDPRAVSSYLPLLIVIIGFSVVWLRSRGPLRPACFAASYFAVSLFPVLGFFSVYFFRYAFVSDHFQYLASMGPLALVGAGIATGLATLELKPAATGAACGLLLFALSLLTWRQTAIYADVVTLYQDTLQKNPGCWMANYNLGISLRDNGDVDGAVSQYRRAIALKPDYAEAHYNLARILVQKGDFEEAISHYNSALAVNRDDAEAQNNLGVTLARIGRMEEALNHYRMALEIKPDHSDAIHNLANALLRSGRTEEAIDYYEQLIRLLPGDPDVHAALGNALFQAGRFEDATSQYRRALEMAPENASVQTKLAWLLSTSPESTLRNGPEAVRLAEKANRLTGDREALVLRVLAAAYAESGSFENALQTARRARDLAETDRSSELLAALDKEIALYQTGSPYHRPPR